MLRPHTLLSLIVATVLTTSACAEHDDAEAAKPAAAPADYQTARALMWNTLYADGGRTLYCDQQFGPRRPKNINIEHVFPMSWVAWHLSCGQRNDCRRSSDEFNRIEADLHNLWPALKNINKARRSHPFGIIKGENHFLRGCDFELDERRRVVEPRPQVRGEIARTMFYMADRYGLEIRPAQGKLLKQWSRQDPVDAEEKRRNDAIERIQGNRNPYIDDPTLVDALRF